MPEPTTDELHTRLRAELVAFVHAAGTRRVLAPVFHLGLPGGRRGRDQTAVADRAGFDADLRTELVGRCLDAVTQAPTSAGPVPLPWLTRTGDLLVTSGDRAWVTAAREAYARRDLRLPGFYVVTRRGWLEVTSERVRLETVRRRRRT